MADIPFTTFAFAGANTPSVTRTMPARIGDIVNVLEFGADNTGNHTNNNAAAITAALATGGFIFFPGGEYWLNGPVSLPYIANPTSGEGYLAFGFGGAWIHGNFPDWLMKRVLGFDNNQIKGFKGFTFTNQHPQGGCLYWADATNTVVEDCGFNTDSIAVVGQFGNGPMAAKNCHFTTLTSPVPQNSVGVAFSSIGGLVQNCDFTNIDRPVMVSGSNNALIANRFEVNNWAACMGMPPTFQIILSTQAGTAGATILNLSNTLGFSSTGGNDIVAVGSISGGASYHIGNTFPGWTATVLNSTQVSINTTSFVADTLLPQDAYIYVMWAHGSMAQAIGGGSGLTMNSNSFEGCIIPIYVYAMNGVINGCNMFMDQHLGQLPAPAHGRAGIWLRDNQQALVVQGCNIGGQVGCTLGGIYFGTGGGAPYNCVFQGNNFGPNPPVTPGLSTGIVNGNQTGTTNLVLYEMPKWLVFPNTDPGFVGPLKLLFIGGNAVTAGTTVTNSHNSPPSIDLSHPVTALDSQGCVFSDSSSSLGVGHTDLQVGLISLR